MQNLAPQRYSTMAIVLHWALAILLLFQLGLGWRMEDLPKGMAEFTAFQLHKSVGISILVLSFARLGIRWVFPRPAPVPGPAPAMFLARAVHALLYVVMIGGPLTGWILVSTSKIKLQTMLFGLVPWPHLPLGRGWHEPTEALHKLIAWLLAALFVLHVAGALRHHWLRSDVIGRMLPASLVSRSALNMAAAAALLAGGLAFAAAWAWPFGEGQPAAQARPPAASLALAPSATPTAAASSEAAPSETASAVVSATSEAAAKATTWQVEPGGRLGFRAEYAGSPVEGAFTRWDAEIRFSPDDLPGSRIRVTIDLASVDTAEAQRDDMLRSSSFFDIGAHPRATFVSNSIRERGPGRYVANGTLTLHGRSQPVAVSFDLAIADDRATASGSARIQRTAFGVGSGEWAGTDQIADGVSINFRLRARRD